MQSAVIQSAYVTVKEASEMLGVSVFTIRRMVDRGQFSSETTTGYRGHGSVLLLYRDELEAHAKGEKKLLAQLRKKRK